LFKNIADFPFADFSRASFSETFVQKVFQLNQRLFLVSLAGIKSVLKKVIFERNTAQSGKSFEALVLIFSNIN